MLFVFLFSSNFAQDSQFISKKYSPFDLKADAKYISEVILKMHPVIGIYNSKEYYQFKYNEFINHINDSLSERDFRMKLKFLFNDLHCGHTDVMASRKYRKQVKHASLKFLPYYLIAMNNKVIVGAAYLPKKDSVLKKGDLVLAINNVDVDSIMNYTFKYLSADGYVTSGKKLFYQTGINFAYPSIFGRPDSFLITTKHGSGIQNNWCKAVKLKEIPVRIMSPNSDSCYQVYKRSNISLGNLMNDKTTRVLKVKKFKGIRQKRIISKVFKKLKREGTKNLVIDLRYNGGGSLANAYKLLTYLLDTTVNITLKTHIKSYPKRKISLGNLGFNISKLAMRFEAKTKRLGDTLNFMEKIKPRKRNKFNGQVYVLINGGTFSASCIVAAYLKEYSHAVLIGSESGGTREGCNAGMTPYFKLPNTKLKMRVPAFRIVHHLKEGIIGRGVMPDYEIKYSFNDFLNRKDLELTKAFELIERKNKN